MAGLLKRGAARAIVRYVPSLGAGPATSCPSVALQVANNHTCLSFCLTYYTEFRIYVPRSSIVLYTAFLVSAANTVAMIDYILRVPVLLYLEQAGVILSIKPAGGNGMHTN